MKFKFQCLQIKCYWNINTPVQFHVAYGCFPSTAAKLRDLLAHKTPSIYYLALYRKILQTPAQSYIPKREMLKLRVCIFTISLVLQGGSTHTHSHHHWVSILKVLMVETREIDVLQNYKIYLCGYL